jgi:hypothetical protein
MQEFDQQLGADPRDDHERTVHQRRIPFYQRGHSLPITQPHHDDAQHAAGQNQPTASATWPRQPESNRDRKHVSVKFDLGRPSPRTPSTHIQGCALGAFRAFLAALARAEVAVNRGTAR